jgi:hypothetical protein
MSEIVCLTHGGFPPGSACNQGCELAERATESQERWIVGRFLERRGLPATDENVTGLLEAMESVVRIATVVNRERMGDPSTWVIGPGGANNGRSIPISNRVSRTGDDNGSQEAGS